MTIYLSVHSPGGLEEAKAEIARATRAGDLPALVDLKAQAGKIRVSLATRNHVRNDRAAYPVVMEVIRRCERAIGIAVLAGQEAGIITRKGERSEGRPSPTDYASNGELHGSRDGRPGFLSLAVYTDEEFDAAIEAAREERNLSRQGIWQHLPHPEHPADWVPTQNDRSAGASRRRREIIAGMAGEGYSSRQISERTGLLGVTVRRLAREAGIDIPADTVLGRDRAHNYNTIVEETTHILDGAVMSLRLVSPAGLDPARCEDWVASLTASARDITKFARAVKEASQ